MQICLNLPVGNSVAVFAPLVLLGCDISVIEMAAQHALNELVLLDLIDGFEEVVRQALDACSGELSLAHFKDVLVD